MSQLSQLRSPAALRATIDEFVQFGRTKFLARYGFGRPRDFLVHAPKAGTDCDSKAIAAQVVVWRKPCRSWLSRTAGNPMS